MGTSLSALLPVLAPKAAPPAEAASGEAGKCSELQLHLNGQRGPRYRFLKSELDAKKSARKPPKPR
jgi:hypothetical protein